MQIALDASGHAASIVCSTAGTNPRLCVACVIFDSGQPPLLTMKEQIVFGEAKRAALDSFASLLGTMPLLVSEPPINLAYSGSPGQRRRAAATLQTT